MVTVVMDTQLSVHLPKPTDLCTPSHPKMQREPQEMQALTSESDCITDDRTKHTEGVGKNRAQ